MVIVGVGGEVRELACEKSRRREQNQVSGHIRDQGGRE
jgi:hypothetical protein